MVICFIIKEIVVQTKEDEATKKLPLEFKQKFHIPTSSTTIDITISIFYYLY